MSFLAWIFILTVYTDSHFVRLLIVVCVCVMRFVSLFCDLGLGFSALNDYSSKTAQAADLNRTLMQFRISMNSRKYHKIEIVQAYTQ